MMRCWRESRDAVDPETLVVQFRLRLLPDGYVETVELLGETGTGPFAAVARQRAAAAIKKCEPYDFLPAENYSGWKDRFYVQRYTRAADWPRYCRGGAGRSAALWAFSRARPK